jgi:hypothetical protein
MSKELIDALEKALVELTKNAIPSYKPPLDDGWIRHTGDVCPVHPRDKVLYTAGGVKYDVEFTAGAIRWDGITHYKVTKKYDPHEKSKSLYAEDALTHKEPWMLWEFSLYENEWLHCLHAPDWDSQLQYRRKQTKKLVNWSCPLLKGANTNCGELLLVVGGNYATLASNNAISQGGDISRLRLAHTDATPSNWQAYNGEHLNALHDAGFRVEIKSCDGMSFYVRSFDPEYPSNGGTLLVQYRVIAIRYGFTDDPAEVV